MIWKKITVDTTTEASDVVAMVLFENGICGAEITDNQNLTEDELKKMYVDIPAVRNDDGKAEVSFYVSIVDKKINDTNNQVCNDIIDNSYKMSTDNIFTKDEFDEILENIKIGFAEYQDFMDMGTLDITCTELDDQVFLNKWKENFKKFCIDDISICPLWDKKETSDISGLNIFIEPGNAFGTGKHSTTKLCVLAIKKLIKEIEISNSSLLDIGCGSGILGIIAKKLGIKSIMAIDVDADVKDNLLENLRLNEINSDFQCDFGNLLEDREFGTRVKQDKYDIVVANILAPVIVSFLVNGKVDEYIKENGYFICSGIIREKEQEVRDAIRINGKLEIVDVLYDEEWLAIICKKKGSND